MKELKIDKQLRDLLPPLTEEEFNQLENNILKDGCTNAIVTWNGYIVDGHNRYNICIKNNIEFEEIVLGYETKDEIMEWMIDTQLGRRNLTPIQRIAIAEKYRPVIERKARDNQGSRNDINFCQNSDKSIVDTKKELAKIANISYDTYYKGKRILESDNEEIKEKLNKKEISINKAYNELFKKENEKPQVSKKDTNKIKLKKCNKCNIEKDISEFYINHDTCKKCEEIVIEIPRTNVTPDILKNGLGETINVNEDSKIDNKFEDLLKDIKTPKNIIDFIDPIEKIESIEELFEDCFWEIDAKLYSVENALSKMNEEHVLVLVDVLDNQIKNINNLKNKLMNEKVGK